MGFILQLYAVNVHFPLFLVEFYMNLRLLYLNLIRSRDYSAGSRTRRCLTSDGFCYFQHGCIINSLYFVIQISNVRTKQRLSFQVQSSAKDNGPLRN